jgi:hypothetical protein
MPTHTVPRKAQCRYTPFGEALLTFPYCPTFIERLKQAVPFRYRTYDPPTKAWTVSPEFADLAIDLLLERFPDAETPRRAHGASLPMTREKGSDHFRILHLRETAPVELIEASYRVLARLNHPDAGGSTEAMQAINGAYAALRERVSA